MTEEEARYARRAIKAQHFVRLLKTNTVVSVRLDGRHCKATIPARLRLIDDLVLEYGLNMPVPIEDLHLTLEGIEATLSFNRTPSYTFVPWDSIFIIHAASGEGFFWPDEAPEGFSLSVPEVAAKAPPAQGRPTFRLVTEEEDAALDAAIDADLDAVIRRPTGPPNLRLVN